DACRQGRLILRRRCIFGAIRLLYEPLHRLQCIAGRHGLTHHRVIRLCRRDPHARQCEQAGQRTMEDVFHHTTCPLRDLPSPYTESTTCGWHCPDTCWRCQRKPVEVGSVTTARRGGSDPAHFPAVYGYPGSQPIQYMVPCPSGG